MNREQAFALARTLAASLAAELEFTVVAVDSDGPTCFWVTDNPEKADDEEGFDPAEATYFSPVNSHTNDGVYVVEQNNPEGGGFVYLDPDTCFELSF